MQSVCWRTNEDVRLGGVRKHTEGTEYRRRKSRISIRAISNGICVFWADIKSVDKCGNIHQFSFPAVGDSLNVNVPDWHEEVHFEAIEKN